MAEENKKPNEVQSTTLLLLHEHTRIKHGKMICVDDLIDPQDSNPYKVKPEKPRPDLGL